IVNQRWGPKVGDSEIGPDLLERWALHYLGRYASSAENLRRVLTRRVRRRSPEAVPATAPLIVALVARYRESGLLDDAAYASARSREPASAGGWPRRCSPVPISARSRRWRAGSPTDVFLKPARGHASAERRLGIQDHAGLRARR